MTKRGSSKTQTSLTKLAKLQLTRKGIRPTSRMVSDLARRAKLAHEQDGSKTPEQWITAFAYQEGVTIGLPPSRKSRAFLEIAKIIRSGFLNHIEAVNGTVDAAARKILDQITERMDSLAVTTHLGPENKLNEALRVITEELADYLKQRDSESCESPKPPAKRVARKICEKLLVEPKARSAQFSVQAEEVARSTPDELSRRQVDDIQKHLAAAFALLGGEKFKTHAAAFAVELMHDRDTREYKFDETMINAMELASRRAEVASMIDTMRSGTSDEKKKIRRRISDSKKEVKKMFQDGAGKDTPLAARLRDFWLLLVMLGTMTLMVNVSAKFRCSSDSTTGQTASHGIRVVETDRPSGARPAGLSMTLASHGI